MKMRRMKSSLAYSDSILQSNRKINGNGFAVRRLQMELEAANRGLKTTTNTHTLKKQRIPTMQCKPPLTTNKKCYLLEFPQCKAVLHQER